MNPIYRNILFLLLVILSVETNAQVFWLSSEILDENNMALVDEDGKNYMQQGIQKELNFNPVFQFDQVEFDIDISDYLLHQSTIFTIYQSNYFSKEENIWNISSNAADKLILTNERLADRKTGSFVNFLDHVNFAPQLNVFSQYTKPFTANTFQLGGKPHSANIPISSFSGDLAEIILFDKNIAPLSKKILESHLAIKYSIPLAAGTSYYNSDGTIIWNLETQEGYFNNIAGLGKNSALKLNQKQSKSSLGKGYIAIGLDSIYQYNFQNLTDWDENAYLLWGNNDNATTFTKANNGISFMERSWKFQGSSFDYSLPLMLRLSEENLLEKHVENNKLWLVWNSSEKNEFQIHSSQIIPLEIANQSLEALEFHYDPQTPYLHLIQAPDFWVAMELDNPKCADNKLGTIESFVLGPEPPYTILLQNQTKQYSFTYNSRRFTIPNIASGQYTFEINTQDGQSWKSTIEFNDTSIPEPQLEELYIVESGQKLSLDLSNNMPETAEYTWILPNGNKHYGPIIRLSNEGIYIVEIFINGCSAVFQTSVKSTKSNIRDCLLYPNPSPGKFILEATLESPTPYTIEVTAMTGEIISKQHFSSTKNIQYFGEIQNDGSYVVSILSGESRYNAPLIIIQNKE